MPKFRISLLKSLPAFEAAARLQSVAKAAAELHVTAGSISRHLTSVEKYVGRALFRRSHNSIVSNEYGQLLHGAVKVAFLSLQRALTQVMGARTSNKLVILVDSDFAALWLVPRLAEFNAIVPDMVIEILTLRDGPSMYDPRICCTIHYANVGTDVEGGEMIFRSRLFPVFARDRFSQVRLASFDDLRSFKLLHDRSFDEWEQYRKACGSASDIDVSTGTVFAETALCMDAAARGQGVAIGDEFLAALYLAEGRLEKAFGPSILSKNAYYLTVLDNSVTNPSVNMFRMWLLQTVQQHRTNLGID